MKKRLCTDCEEEFRPEYAGQVCCKSCSGQGPAITDDAEEVDTNAEDEDDERSSLDVDVVFDRQLLNQELRAMSFAEPVVEDESLVEPVGLHRY